MGLSSGDPWADCAGRHGRALCVGAQFGLRRRDCQDFWTAGARLRTLFAMGRHPPRETDIDRAFAADDAPEAWTPDEAEELRRAEAELAAYRQGGRVCSAEEVKAGIKARRESDASQ
jgi:hypothetical protein